MSFQTERLLAVVIARFGMVLLAVWTAVALLALVVSRALPGGGAIGFLSFRDGSMDIYVLDIIRGTLHNLSDNDAVNGSFAFSPDGIRIVFESNKDGNTELYMMNVECPSLLSVCGGIVQLTDGETDSLAPIWSPNGRYIAYIFDVSFDDGNNEIYVMDMATWETINVTNSTSNDYYPAWAYDGKMIVYVSYPDASSDDYLEAHIYVVNADGSHSQRITPDDSYSLSPAWSPENDEVAFVSRIEEGQRTFITALDGSNFRAFINSNNAESDFAWSPNGKEVAFKLDMNDEWDLCIMSIDEAHSRCITNSFDENIGRFAWSPDGRYFAFHSESGIYLIATTGGNLRRLADQSFFAVWWP